MDGPPLPAICRYVWEWFTEVSAARSSNGFGANPISYQDIAAWSALTGTLIRPHEVRVLLRLDAAFLIGMQAGKPTKPKGGKRNA